MVISGMSRKEHGKKEKRKKKDYLHTFYFTHEFSSNLYIPVILDS